MKVKNTNGYELDFEATAILMDDELREKLANKGFDNEQEFFTAYERAHEEKYHEEWELSKENPTW